MTDWKTIIFSRKTAPCSLSVCLTDSILLTLFYVFLQQDVVGCHDSMAEMETNILDDTQDSYSESHVEEMESEDKTE